MTRVIWLKTTNLKKKFKAQSSINQMLKNEFEKQNLPCKRF